MPLNRRELLAVFAGGSFYMTLPSHPVAAALSPPGTAPVQFPQGVASGDPQSDSVVLWTRALPGAGVENPDSVALLVQLSDREDFEEILLQEEIHATNEHDHTVRAFVDGLQPDTRYYYRFVGAKNSKSRIGRTRTAPASDQQRAINVAFSSCQSYEPGYYGGWARMLSDDLAAAEEDQIDFVLHLGDFIYERAWNTRYDGSPQSRVQPPFPDGFRTDKNRYAVSLADYRQLYKVYLSDPHLQAARARWPFICTWDDHEFSNNNFQSFSTYGGEAVADPERKLHGNKAWFEYIPAVLDELRGQPSHGFRPAAPTRDPAAANREAIHSLQIYRRLQWGAHLDVVMTDCRSYRSPPCVPAGLTEELGLPLMTIELVSMLDAGRDYNNGNPPATLPYGDGKLPNPARDRAPGSMLGSEQYDWFIDTLSSSPSTWKLWGNAVPLLPMYLDMSSVPFTDYEDSVVTIDPWAGYPGEKNRILQHLHDNEITGLVSFSGDHHLHGAATLSPDSGADAPAVAVDFAVTAMSSSPVFEDLLHTARRDFPDFQPLVYKQTDEGILPLWNLSMLRGVLASLAYDRTGLQSLSSWLGPNEANRGLQFLDSTANGYGLATFAADELRVQLVTLEDVTRPFDQAPAVVERTRFRVPVWDANRGAEMQGPDFEGIAPFPFAQTFV
ncbi:MAG: alkaline phosphatase D family protein [Pseudomonadota bacterium]